MQLFCGIEVKHPPPTCPYCVSAHFFAEVCGEGKNYVFQEVSVITTNRFRPPTAFGRLTLWRYAETGMQPTGIYGRKGGATVIDLTYEGIETLAVQLVVQGGQYSN